MQVKVFTIPVLGGEEANQEMNIFLANHRVVDVKEQIVCDKFWTFCVRYVNAPNATSSKPVSTKDKVDYRDVLPSDVFVEFLKMREVRKELSTERGVPPFVIFTDAELASLASLEDLTIENALQIPGIGKKHAENVELLINRLNERQGGEKAQ